MLVVFVLALAAGILVHLNLPATRAVVRSEVSRLLDSALPGDITIVELEELHARGIARAHVVVRDPSGVPVIEARDVSARIDTFELVLSLARGRPHVDLLDARIGEAAVSLESGDDGRLRLVAAFVEPEETEPEDPVPAEQTPVTFDLRRGVLARGIAFGHPSGAPFPIAGETRDAVTSIRVDGAGVDVAVERARVETWSMPARLDPRGAFAGRLTSRADAEGIDALAFDAALDGSIGGMPASVDARLRSGRLDGSLDLRGASGDRVSALTTELDVKDPIALHASVGGDLPRIAVEIDVEAGDAQMTVDGTVTLGDTLGVEGIVSAREIDLSRIVEGAPRSALGLDGRARVQLTDAGPIGEIDARTLPGTLAGKRLPPIVVTGTVNKERADARALVDARGIHAEVVASLVPVADPAPGKERVVEATARVRASDLSELPVVGDFASGSARASVDGRLLLPSLTVGATMALDGEHIRVASIRADSATLRATIAGSAGAPAITASLGAHDVGDGNATLRAIDARAHVTRTDDDAFAFDDVEASAARGAVTMTAQANRIVVSERRVVVDDAVMHGLGEPVRASFERDRERLHARFDAPAVDIARVGQITGAEELLRRGTIAVQGDVVVDRSGLHGDALLQAHGADIAELAGVNARVHVRAREREIDADVHATLADSGHLDVATRGLELHGPPTSAAAWLRATGSLAFDLDVDLEKAASVLPEGALPSSQSIGGHIAALGHVRRAGPVAPPEVSVHAHTRGLVVSGAPFRSRGVDIGVDVRSDAPSGFFEIASRLSDRAGPIVALDLKSRLPYDALLRDPAALREVLVRAPLTAKVVLPERPIAWLPEALGLRDFEGRVAAEIDLEGPLLDPRLSGTVRAAEVCIPGAPLRTPVDARVRAVYDGEKVVVSTSASTADREVLDLTSRIDVRLRDVLEPRGSTPPWKASARGRIQRFPLAALPPVGGRALGGTISGDVVVEGLHENARARAELAVDEPSVGPVRYERGKVIAFAGGGGFGASTRLERGGSHVDARISGGLTWGSRIVPAIDETRTLDMRLQAKRFELSVAQPFVAGQLAAVEGVLDANASLHFDPRTHETTMNGGIAVRDGGFHLVALGQYVRDIRATVKLGRGGRVELEDFHARSADGEVHANGSVELDGLRVARASANVRIPEKRPLDVVLGGQPIGEIWGRASIRATAPRDGNVTTISVDVPVAGLELPQNLKTGVQELEKRKKILVGHYRDDGRFVEHVSDRADGRKKEGDEKPGPSLVVNVALRKVAVTRGNTVEVTLEGEPTVTIGDETRIRGSIRATGGTIDVRGKEFEIQRATATFDGNTPPNPSIVATASWRAADGTRVFADFVGPAKGGEVQLRSEPPRPQHEILALIVFGTADGANPTPTGGRRGADGTTKTAVSLGGGLAAEGLTEAIDDLTGVQATARIDTTLPNNPRPEIEFQITPTISIEFARVIGTPPLFAPDKTLATFEWRFVTNWSLETTIGDRGTAKLDALWRKRY